MTMTAGPRTEDELEERLSRPTPFVIDALARTAGDVVVIGAGGKMGPSLTRMLLRAAEVAGCARRVTAVSRFSDAAAAESLARAGARVLPVDLSRPDGVRALPQAANVIYMAGQKFGTQAAPDATWHANVVIPATIAEQYAGARVVVFSTGNVYPLVAADGRGATEDTTVAPVGEYAWTCLGRERVFTRAARLLGSRVSIVRLNYAVDLRYGVLVDLALRVRGGEPIDLGMGSVNVIWQGDANAQAIALLAHAASPPCVVNVTGPEVLWVREAALELGRLLDRPPVFTGSEQRTALLSDSSRACTMFGAPTVPTAQLVAWVAEWLRAGGRTLGKATHFEERGGAF